MAFRSRRGVILRSLVDKGLATKNDYTLLTLEISTGEDILSTELLDDVVELSSRFLFQINLLIQRNPTCASAWECLISRSLDKLKEAEGKAHVKSLKEATLMQINKALDAVSLLDTYVYF